MPDSGSAAKRCRDCGAVKPLEDFSPSKKARDGRVSYCRPCLARRHQQYRRAKAESEGRKLRERRQVPPGHRWCPECQSVKPLEEFPRNRSSKTGRGGYCKPCHNAKGRETYLRLYGGTREYHLRRRYGIGQAEVDAMLASQGGLCAACRQDPAKHVDHDHVTGQVRGMFCFLCNQALGNVRDDIGRLHGLIGYLRRSRGFHRVTTIELYPEPAVVIEIDPAGFHAA